MPDSSLLIVVVLLATTVVLVGLLKWLRLPAIFAYLLTGVLLGPHALALVPDLERTRQLAEFGVVFLMFSIGLEFSPAQFMAMRRLVFGMGSLQVLASLLLFLAIATFLGLGWRSGIIVGGILAMSSTAMVARVLSEKMETASRHGRIAISILLFQDLAVVPLLVLIPALAGDRAALPAALALAALKAAVILLVLLVLGRPVVRPWFQLVAQRKSSELFMLNVLFVTLGLAWITEAAGLSLALGAFVAGMLIAETAYRYQVEADIAAFRDILLGLFFITIGMLVDLHQILADFPEILVILVAILVIKGIVVWASCRLFAFEQGVALRTALVLAQAGEFGFVLLSLANQFRLLPAAVLQPLLGAMLLSLVLAPIFLEHNGWIAQRLVRSYRRGRERSLRAIRSLQLKEHVILCGYGRVGQSIARVLEEEGIPYLALDLDPSRVRQAQSAGESIFFGDASRRDVLQASGLAEARALVVTFGDVATSRRVLAVASELQPRLPLLARAHDDSQIAALEAAGADEVVPEVTEGALMLASQTLLQLGFPLSQILRRVRRFREERYRVFRGSFWGGSEPGEDQGSPRLLSVSLGDTGWAIGKTLAELNLPALGVQVTALRRQGIRGRDPADTMRLRADDVLVIFGDPKSLQAAQQWLLEGPDAGAFVTQNRE